LHFGTDLHSKIETNNTGQDYLNIHTETGGGLEGHLFMTINANFMVFDILKNK
jgi:hypothetical protein